MKTIAFDLDEVLFAFHRPLIEWHNEVYGTSHSFIDMRDPLIFKLWQCEEGEAGDRIAEFLESPLSSMLSPIPGMPTISSLVRARGDVPVVMTARSNLHRDITYSILDRHYGGIFEDVIFTGRGKGADYKSLPKEDFCRKIGASHMMEDHPITAYNCARAGIDSILFARPWNAAYQARPLLRRLDRPGQAVRHIYPQAA